MSNEHLNSKEKSLRLCVFYLLYLIANKVTVLSQSTTEIFILKPRGIILKFSNREIRANSKDSDKTPQNVASDQSTPFVTHQAVLIPS